MARAPVTRTDLRRALVANALGKPVNVLVPAGVLAAGALLGAWWLAAVAVACWLVLSGMTFFDEREAQAVGERVRAARRRQVASQGIDFAALDAGIAGRLKEAREARTSIRAAVEASGSPHTAVADEVDELVAALEVDAGRAQRIHEFLARRSPAEVERRMAALRSSSASSRDEEARLHALHAYEAQLAALTRLRQRLDALLAEMDHVVVTLETVLAEVLATEDVGAPIGHGAVAGRVSELRTRVQLVSAGLEEAFAETRSSPQIPPSRSDG